MANRSKRRRRRVRRTVLLGRRLEDELAKEARRLGWHVELRRQRGGRIVDLVVESGQLVFVVQVKNMGDVGSDAVRQAKRDWLAYVEAKLGMRIDELVMKALGGRKVIPVVVAWSFRPRTRSIARSHGVWLYSVGEFLELLRRYAPARAK